MNLPLVHECGSCTACCSTLPILELSKPAGTPCPHLAPEGCGCSIYDQRPSVCRSFRCAWLSDSWLNARPQYRPDRLGAVLHVATGSLNVWEVAEGALASPTVRYLVQKLRERLRLNAVRMYPAGILDNEPCTPGLVQIGGIQPARDPSWSWQFMGNGEHRAVRRLSESEEVRR